MYSGTLYSSLSFSFFSQDLVKLILCKSQVCFYWWCCGGEGVVPREILAENLPRRRRKDLMYSWTAASQKAAAEAKKKYLKLGSDCAVKVYLWRNTRLKEAYRCRVGKSPCWVNLDSKRGIQVIQFKQYSVRLLCVRWPTVIPTGMSQTTY